MTDVLIILGAFAAFAGIACVCEGNGITLSRAARRWVEAMRRSVQR